MKLYVSIAVYVHDIDVVPTTDPGGGSSLEMPHPIIDDRKVFKHVAVKR